MIRYQVPDGTKLSQKQRALVYCLNQAGLSGRDMMYDQNNRYNLRIRYLLESIYTGFEGDKSTNGWEPFRDLPQAHLVFQRHSSPLCQHQDHPRVFSSVFC